MENRRHFASEGREHVGPARVPSACQPAHALPSVTTGDDTRGFLPVSGRAARVPVTVRNGRASGTSLNLREGPGHFPERTRPPGGSTRGPSVWLPAFPAPGSSLSQGPADLTAHRPPPLPCPCWSSGCVLKYCEITKTPFRDVLLRVQPPKTDHTAVSPRFVAFISTISVTCNQK